MARTATVEDAIDAIQAVHDAITCCTADHRNDPATLERWLANKHHSASNQERSHD